MKPDEFIFNVIELYQGARVTKYSNEKIRRGRSHSISSAVEDLFASYLVNTDTDIECILVDQPITIHDAKVTFYPDITIIKKGVICGFLDLKMDLGFKRTGLVDLCNKDKQLLSNIRSLDASYKDGITKQKMNCTISKNAIYDIVIISDQNIQAALLKSQLTTVRKISDYSMVHILSSREHLNTYGYSTESLFAKVLVEQGVFKQLMQRISV